MSSLHSPKTQSRRLSVAEVAALQAAVAKGEAITAVAARFNVSRPTVYRALEKAGVSAGARRANDGEARVSVRLQPHEVAAIDRLSHQMGASRAELCRRVLARASGFLEADPELTDAVKGLSRDLKTIGGHLNQIAAHLNREAILHGRSKPTQKQLEDVERFEREVKSTARQLDRMFGAFATRRKARVADLLKVD